MTDEHDPKVTAAYRALGAEEPPRALDDAILAASRRPRISPARSWTQRWALPLSLAAVVVLSVTVTLHMQLEQPGIDGLQAPPPAETAKEQPSRQSQPLELKSEEPRKLAAKPQARQDARRAEPKAFADVKPERARESVALSAPAPAPPAAMGGLSSRNESGRSEDLRQGDSALRREEERVARDAEAGARAPQVGATLAKRPAPETSARVAAAPPAAPGPAAAPASAGKPASEQAARLAGETPGRELERIAQLRAEGKHDEADKALADFRKRHPDYRIAEEMLQRVERR